MIIISSMFLKERMSIMGEYLWYYIGGFLLIVLAVLVIFFVYRKKRNDRIGVKGEKKVARILKPWAFMQNYKVINDLYLPLYDKTTQIDHVVIGFFGLIVIETKNLGGEIYGNPKEKNWTHIMGSQKHTLYNPVMQNQAHIDCIRHWLGKENIYNIAIDNVVVFANNKAELYLTTSDAVILKIKHLKKLLHKAKYEKDKDVDVERVYQALMKHRVTDRALINRHNQDVKEMAAQKR